MLSPSARQKIANEAINFILQAFYAGVVYSVLAAGGTIYAWITGADQQWVFLGLGALGTLFLVLVTTGVVVWQRSKCRYRRLVVRDIWISERTRRLQFTNYNIPKISRFASNAAPRVLMGRAFAGHYEVSEGFLAERAMLLPLIRSIGAPLQQTISSLESFQASLQVNIRGSSGDGFGWRGISQCGSQADKAAPCVLSSADFPIRSLYFKSSRQGVPKQIRIVPIVTPNSSR